MARKSLAHFAQGDHRMANYKIEDVEGIGPVLGEKFRAAGVKDTDALLKNTLTPGQRKTLAETTGLSEARVLKFANMVDLYRVSGVGSEYAELLEVAGVDTVPELARRNASSLTEAMAAVNQEKKLTRQVPTESEVTKWIEQAKGLPRMLEY
jgi:predicted flap endonuclease-1-like 5' DNA nuclease